MCRNSQLHSNLVDIAHVKVFPENNQDQNGCCLNLLHTGGAEGMEEGILC